jgi:hypothetical protein
VCAAVVGAGTWGIQSEYELTVADAIETPERTVTIDGDEHTIRSVSAVDSGEDIVVETTVPEGATYDVELRNADEQVVSRWRKNGSGSVTFDTGTLELDPGTYAVVIFEDQHIRDVQPVIVSGYDLTVDVPDSVAPGSSTDAVVDLTYTARNSAPEGVEVVAFRGDEVIRVEANESGTRQYVANLSFGSDAPTGEYSVYAVAKSEEQLTDNYPILLAIDDGITITVEEESTDSGGTIGGGTGDTDEPDESQENDSTSNETETGDSDAGNETSPDTDNTTQPNDDSGTDPSSDDSGVINPSNSTNTNKSSNEQSIEPLVFVMAFAVVLLTVVARCRPAS